MSLKQEESDFLILIVDDVAKNLQLLGKILDNRGYKVIAVTSGDQVLEMTREYMPDLILLDIMMPGKNGFEVCKELRRDSTLSEIPVIFLTARSEEEDVIKGFNLGGSDYVTKPFKSGELLARIETHLNLKAARDQIVQQQAELKQLTDTREKLYSIIAHDLRGALFGIYGLAEIVEKDITDQPVSDEIKEMVKMVSSSANSATQILENLLAWTRHQSDRLDLNLEKFSISDEIEQSISLYQTQANRKQVEINIKSETENGMVHADKQMVSTVIRNLLSNAIKFSNEGDEIIVELLKNDETIQVSVKDQGIGMPEEVRESIFNPKQRPKRDGTNNEKGVGLGLLLCKEFIEAHNGKISVKSEPENGSEFWFSIPHQGNNN